ncbi:putative FRE ferric reductase-like transmembrane component [Biscogniauxia mediterranea]|nr:putative FRE ferric reductase-like transmembrane component [Biscogniauxia mediterranea]
MDNSAMGGTPWLDDPVMLHSSRADSCKLTAEQCVYRSGHWRYWYEADHVFALSTVYFFIAAIGISTVGFWSLRLAPPSLRNKPWWQKSLSCARFLSYRRQEVKGLHWRLPSWSVSILLAIGAIFFLVMTLGPQPYYWPNTPTLSYGSSPPIATRTGWMALACMPFMIILPTKSNMIASLTGVSHERLIVFHNWVGWAMFALALVHTFPFVVYHTWKGDMVSAWNTSLVYWTGVVALMAQAYLQVFSLRSIRDRFYEFFKATHYIAALVFVLFFFFHCDFRLSSWDYFIATGVLYSVQFFYSQIRTYCELGCYNRATLTRVSNLALKVTIPIDTTWQPGQHVFLRFIHLGLHALTAHPFTICSLPSARHSKGKSTLVFYVQPRGGLTGRLAAAAAQKPSLSVPILLDGVYGGIKGRPLYTYDYKLIIACGAGAGFSLPFVMEAILHSTRYEDTEKSPTQTQVIIATRDNQLEEWYAEALEEFLEDNDIPTIPDNVTITVYCTGQEGMRSESTSTSNLKPGSEDGLDRNSRTRVHLQVVIGRPDITNLVKDATLQSGVSVGIAACGPTAVLRAVQDEAAAAQLRILNSTSGARDVYLHSESFW